MSKVTFDHSFGEHHLRLAMEMGMSIEEGKVSVDPKRITKHALEHYLSYCLGEVSEYDRVSINRAYKKEAEQFEDSYMIRLPYASKMYAHQKEGMFYGTNLRNFFFFFEQGLGKSVVALSIPEMLSMRRTIIVCPAVMKYQWVRDQVDKWGFDELQFTVLDRQRRHTLWGFNERFVVINYEMLHRFKEYILKGPVDCVILDEAHMIKNHKTKRFQAVKKFLEEAGWPKTLLLTGTPITNRVNDVFSYFHLIGHPVGKNYEKFLNFYAKREEGVGGSKVVGVKRPHELRTRIANRCLRKKTEECLDLPPVIARKQYIPEEEQTDKYTQVVQEMASKKREVAAIDKRMKGTDDPETLKALREERKNILMEVRGNIHTLNRLASVAKTEHLRTLIDNLYEQGEKCVVFSAYREPLLEMHEKYGPQESSIIIGGMDAYKKEQMKNKFLERPENKVMLAQVVAGGKGINLVNCRTVIFCGLPFTPDNIEQPYKRVHRIGQDRTVNVHFLMTEGGIDEYIYDLILEKVGDIKEVMDKDKEESLKYEQLEEAILNKVTDVHTGATA